MSNWEAGKFDSRVGKTRNFHSMKWKMESTGMESCGVSQ